MTCKQIEEMFLQGKPLDRAAEEHIAGCPACQALFQTEFPTTEQLDPADIARYQRLATQKLRPVRPIASERQLTFFLLIVFICFTVAAAVTSGSSGLQSLAWWQAVLYLGTVAVAVLFAASALVQEIRPGARRYFNSRSVVVLASAAILAIVAVLFHNLNANKFLLYGEGCLELGLECAFASAILFAILMKGGFSIHPVRTGVVTGFFSGLAGVAVLAVYCPLLTIPHIWVWHLGVLPLSMLVGAAVGFLIQKISSPRNLSDRSVETP